MPRRTPRQAGGDRARPGQGPAPIEPVDPREETPWTPLPRPEVLAALQAPGAGGSDQRDNVRVRAMLIELEKRQCEALKLYEPLPAQLAFHNSMSRQRILRGSNRSGKTLSSVVELAYALTGQHPVAEKYPREFGRAIVVAQDEEKIGEVIWAKLGRAGAFRMLRDPRSHRWRAWRPGDRDKGKAAPPLLPPRLIKDITWISKKAHIPRKLVMKNGWECNFYSGQASSDSVQGMDVDICLFDEEIKNAGWFNEGQARLIDRNGWFWWAATPRVGTQQLYDLHLRALACAEEQEEALR